MGQAIHLGVFAQLASEVYVRPWAAMQRRARTHAVAADGRAAPDERIATAGEICTSRAQWAATAAAGGVFVKRREEESWVIAQCTRAVTVEPRVVIAHS